MADWTPLPNQAVGVGGLPSGTTVTALRDNPIAIAEGAPGAPVVYGFAAAPQARQAKLPVLSGLTASNAVELDRTHWSGNWFDVSTTSSTFQTAGTVEIVLFNGTVRFRATLTNVGSGAESQIRILKNGSIVQTFTRSGSGSTTFAVDISAVVGDEFEWQVRRSGTGEPTIRNIGVTANDGYTRIGLPILGSDL